MAENQEAIITRGQSLFITVASIVSALTTFVVTWIPSKTLGTSDYKEFLVFWSLTSLVFATIIGVQQESTRLIGAQSLNRTAQVEGRGTRPVLVALGVGVVSSLAFVALTPLWKAKVLEQDVAWPVAFITVAAIAYACHVFFIGAMAGSKAWTEYGLLISTGGIFCLAGTALAAFFKADLHFYELPYILTAFLWVFFLLGSARVRRAAKLSVATPASKIFSNMLWAMLTALAIAIMSTGFPVLLQSTSSHGATDDALLAAIIVGISLTRAPIMLPLQSFQGVAIAHFLGQKGKPAQAMVKPTLTLVALGAVGALAAYLLGPWLLRLIYPHYADQLDGMTLALLTFAAGLLAVTTLSGTAALAMEAHRVYLAGWVATVLVSLCCLFVPGGIIFRTLLALIAGPVIGYLVHLAGMEASYKKQKQ